jgi:hypothetical protein
MAEQDILQVPELAREFIASIYGRQKENGKKMNAIGEIFVLVTLNLAIRTRTVLRLYALENYDGMVPLLRSAYEMQLAFWALEHAIRRQPYVDLYVTKTEWDNIKRLRDMSFADESGEFQEVLNQSLADYNAAKGTSFPSFKEAVWALNDKINRMKTNYDMRETAQWYELASGKTNRELSQAYASASDHQLFYGEASGWVHSQRLYENVSLQTFDQSDESLVVSKSGMIRIMQWLVEDLEFLVGLAKVEGPEFKALLDRSIAIINETKKAWEDSGQA